LDHIAKANKKTSAVVLITATGFQTFLLGLETAARLRISITFSISSDTLKHPNLGPYLEA